MDPGPNEMLVAETIPKKRTICDMDCNLMDGGIDITSPHLIMNIYILLADSTRQQFCDAVVTEPHSTNHKEHFSIQCEIFHVSTQYGLGFM